MEISLGFSEQKLPAGQHICYIFNDEIERRKLMSQYIKSGLENNEKFLYLVDTMSIAEFSNCMKDMGIDIHRYERSLIIGDALPAYCPEGTFSCPDMLKVVGNFYNNSIKEGFSGSRGTGEMSWALRNESVSRRDLMEYEAKLNAVLKEFPYTACCQYDSTRFDGETIMDVLSVHPLMIVRGQIVKNPFFMNPEDFLVKLSERCCSECKSFA